MRDAIAHLNYLSVLVVAAVGFVLGWLWYSPLLFGKLYMTEMKLAPSGEAEAAPPALAPLLFKSFLFTLLGTLGLAALIQAHQTPTWKHGAAYGAFIGLFTSVMRMLNGSVWEKRPWRAQVVIAAHEVLLYAVQGAILGVWR